MVKRIGQPFDALGRLVYRALATVLLLSMTSCSQSAPDEPAALSGALHGSPVTTRATPPPLTNYTLAPMLDKVLPAVVNISTQSTVQVRRNSLLDDPFFRRFFDIPDTPSVRRSQSLGSGVIVDAKLGLILTNHHVVGDADEITVTLRDQRSFKAKLLGDDKETDVALLKIDAKQLTAIDLADSDRLRVGDFVVAIGNPFGLGQTVTYGIVSALGRSGLGIEGYEDFIQTDASINPGNSGGALVTLEGQLVGINTAIVGPSGGNVGIGFAIPSNMVRGVAAQLREHGEIRRGQLGALFQDVTPELARAFNLAQSHGGAVVARVLPKSPAEAAGLRTGDVLTAVNGQPLRNAGDLRNVIGLLPIGTRVTMDLLREGRPLRLSAKIAAYSGPRFDAGKVSKRLSGAELGEIDPDHPLAGKVAGVQIQKIDPGSNAALAGLRAGDIIVAINRQPLSSLAEVETLASSTRNALLLNVRRGELALSILLR